MTTNNKRPRTNKQVGSSIKQLVFSTEERFAIRLRALAVLPVKKLTY